MKPDSRTLSFLRYALALGPVLALTFSLYAHQIAESDIGMHLKEGEWIWQHRAIPLQDPFSYTASSTPWIDIVWLYQLFVYGLFALGGVTLLTLVHAAAATLSVLLLCHSCAPRTSLWARSLATLPLVAAHYSYTWIRPQVFTLLLMSVYFWMLRRDRPLTVVRMAALLILQAVWANLHGGYLVGLFLLAIYSLEQWMNSADRAPDPSDLSGRRARSLVLLILAVLTVFLNPFGWALVRHGFRELSSVYARQNISEWISPLKLFWHPDAQVFFVLLAVVYLTSLFRRGAMRPFLAGASLLFAVMTLRSIRFTPLFYLGSIPLLAENLSLLPRPPSDSARRNLRRIAWIAAVALPLAGIWLTTSGKLYALIGRNIHPGFGMDSTRLPVGAAQLIKEQGLPQPLYNVYEDGGYLMWSLYPDYKVFVDSRNLIYGDDLLFSMRKVQTEPGHFHELDSTYRFQTILVPHALFDYDGLVSLLLRDATWMLVHADYYACVFVRRDDPRNTRLKEIDLRGARPPEGFRFPAAPAPGLSARWRALLFEPMQADWIRNAGYEHLYRLAGNEVMQNYWMARTLQEAPPFALGYGKKLARYRAVYAQIPEWMKAQ